MGFLNSLLLLFGAFALVPILVHLLNRHRVKVVMFSSLRYLKSLQKTRMRRLRIRQLLLLILRMLIVLAIVAAFARPTLKGDYSSGFGSAARTSAVILLDNSLSMTAETRDGTLFESGRDFALRLLDVFGEGDEILFATYNYGLETSGDKFHLDASVVERAIHESEVSYLTTDPRQALTKAHEFLSQSMNSIREMYVISDFSEYGWATFSGMGDINPLPEMAALYFVPVVDPEPDNIKVKSLDFGRQLVYPDRPVQIACLAANDNPVRVNGVLASLFIDGKRVGQTDLDIPASSEAQVEFVHTFESPGFHYGYVELPDDAILGDNRFYFTLNIPRAIKVLAIGNAEEDNLYIKLAVRPQSDTPTQIEIRSIGLASLPREDLFAYDCIVLNAVEYLSESAFSAIDKFVSSGGNILLFVPPDGDQKFYNSRVLKRYFDAQLLGTRTVESGSGYYSLENFAVSHPIFSRYTNLEKLPEIRFARITRIRASDKVRILGRYSSGDPAILESDWGQGKAVLFAGDLKAESSEFVRHSLFVTFINRTIEYLASDMTKMSGSQLVGETNDRMLAGVTPGQQTELLDPTGERRLLTPKFSGRTSYFSTQDALIPGIYRILASDTTAEMFALNVNTDETVQRYRDLGVIAGRIPEYNSTVLDPNDSRFADVIHENRYGREVWHLFLLAALGLMAVEMFVARSGRSGRVSPE